MKPTKRPVSFYDYLLRKGYTEHEVIEWRGIAPGLYTDLPPIEKLPRLRIEHPDGVEDVLYAPTRVQRLFHASVVPNCILEGPRGTGKSIAIRNDAHMRAMAIPGWNYLILRRQMGDLQNSHLKFMKAEMHKLGGTFNLSKNIAYYPNGSLGFFSYCVTLSDVMNLLSSEFGGIYFDEITTFLWEMVIKISACARVPEDSGLVAFVKGGTNPLGVGAQDVKEHFITKSVRPENEPDYDPDQWEAIRTKPEDNPYLDWKQYTVRLGSLQERTKRAWLDGEWLNEGAYFTEFRVTKEGRPWHVIPELPTLRGQSILSQPWVKVYRALDWGFRPDPAVCIWFAVLPSGHTIAFKERSWRETLAKDVALDIKRESEGMRVVDTFADPSIFAKKGETLYSVGDIIESNGVPLTPSVNDRVRFGAAICDYLNSTLQEEGEEEILDQDGLPMAMKRMFRDYPKLQILEKSGRMGCPDLIRTISDVQTDPRDQRAIAEGEDHWVVTLAYFCMGDAPPPRDPDRPTKPRWMMTKKAFGSSFNTRL